MSAGVVNGMPHTGGWNHLKKWLRLLFLPSKPTAH